MSGYEGEHRADQSDPDAALQALRKTPQVLLEAESEHNEHNSPFADGFQKFIVSRQQSNVGEYAPAKMNRSTSTVRVFLLNSLETSTTKIIIAEYSQI